MGKNPVNAVKNYVHSLNTCFRSFVMPKNPVKKAKSAIMINILSTPIISAIYPKGARLKAPIPQLKPCITPEITPLCSFIRLCAATIVTETERNVKYPEIINIKTAKSGHLSIVYIKSKTRGRIVQNESLIMFSAPIFFSILELVSIEIPLKIKNRVIIIPISLKEKPLSLKINGA